MLMTLNGYGWAGSDGMILRCGEYCRFPIAVAGVMMGAVSILAVAMAFAFDGIEEDDGG